MKKKTFPHELIGEDVEVTKAKNVSCLGLRGKVVDETRSTLTIDHQGKRKMIIKNNVTIRLGRTKQEVKGSLLQKRPEERLK